ncbi:MAG: small subunit ribosomal protein S5 [Microgenomates group bacterium LiPW_31]|nr:MAG: small subunit ribosomal protein S5 [Microgenomates group bacterium LiPW_31]
MEYEEFEEKVVQVNRVSKKTKGGNKIAFSVLMVVGDKKGKVGIGLGKAPDVSSAIRKGLNRAKKNLIEVPMRGTTIPYQIRLKHGAAEVLLKPAPPGTGVIAGGAVRDVVEAAGIKDIVSKILGSDNKASNVYATMEALKKLKTQSSKLIPRQALRPRAQGRVARDDLFELLESERPRSRRPEPQSRRPERSRRVKN